MQHCADGHGKVGMLATVYGDQNTEPTILADCGRSGWEAYTDIPMHAGKNIHHTAKGEKRL